MCEGKTQTGAFLRKKFFAGKLAATDVAEGASSLELDCPTECPANLRRWGKSMNQSAKKAYRSVMREFDRECELPDVYQAYLDGWDNKANKPMKILASFMLPHEVLHHFVSTESHGSWSDFAPHQENLKHTLASWGAV